MEECLKSSGIESHAVVRMGFLQNWLFAWAGEISEQNKMSLPVKQDAPFAPLNLSDLCLFVARLVAEHQMTMMRGAANMFQLTGMDLVNGKQLVDKMNRVLATNIRYEELDRSKAEQWFHRLFENRHLACAALEW